MAMIFDQNQIFLSNVIDASITTHTEMCMVWLTSPRQGASRCVRFPCVHAVAPGTVTEGTALLIPPVLSTFPAWVGGSACATSFSRIAQRSLTLRPVHSLDHLK